MIKSDSQKKLLLISLDGLSANDFHHLAESHSFFSQIAKTSGIRKLVSMPLASPQAIWAELLTGLTWYQTGCAGYARPRSSLNDLVVESESTINSSFSLASASSPGLTINIPLIEPKENRVWLSDGSMITERLVEPKELALDEPFKSYKARPFASPGYLLSNPNHGAELAIEVEKSRLACALELVKSTKWQVCLLKLSIFDTLAHLLGPDFLSADLKCTYAIEAFITFANQHLSAILSQASGATICVMSPYSHGVCTTRINLNMLLARLGLCRLLDKEEALVMTAKRQEASLLIAERQGALKGSSPMVAVTNTFVTTKSKAASLIQGAIYLNDKDRFADGILGREEANLLRKEIGHQITTILRSDAGIEEVICTTPDENNHDKMAPDLILYAPGVEFHDIYDAPAVDRFSHPLSSHLPEGFAWVSNDQGSPLTPISLHKLLQEKNA